MAKAAPNMDEGDEIDINNLSWSGTSDDDDDNEID